MIVPIGYGTVDQTSPYLASHNGITALLPLSCTHLGTSGRS
ncbi:hypothetical protein SAMN04489726_0098 [Allokutzneria albata]|uniref:Uncharacterized protein n=1 Tax=Allokutzneria albata TaxID=211114 RepID=A0A1G9QYW0_ALLAB|nr:hypothetical protein SAMN04489726_0098 [Allokutzneria albata]